MANERPIPAFTFLGYNINKIIYQRHGEEELEKAMFSVLSKEYDKETKIYSLVVEVKIEFSQNKNNVFEILGGFYINSEEIVEDEKLVSAFSATLFPFIRTLIYNVSLDDRESIKLPTLDLRNIDVGKGIIMTK